MSDTNQRGYIDFVVKLYPDGKMSRVLDAMKIGDTIEIKGPKGRFKYQRGSKSAIGQCGWGGVEHVAWDGAA